MPHSQAPGERTACCSQPMQWPTTTSGKVAGCKTDPPPVPARGDPMGSAPPAHGRPHRATPVPRARQPQPRRLRRRRWLAVVAVTLVLAAALVPRALADPDEGGSLSLGWGDPVSLGPSSEDSGVLTQTKSEQPQTDTNAQPPTAVNTDGGSGSGDSGVVADGATPPNEKNSQDPAPLVAEHDPAHQEAGDQHNATAMGGSGDLAKQPTARQDQANSAEQGQQADANQGCRAAGSCSTKALGSGASTVAVAGGWSLRGVLSRAVRRGQPQQEPTQPRDTPPAEEEGTDASQPATAEDPLVSAKRYADWKVGTVEEIAMAAEEKSVTVREGSYLDGVIKKEVDGARAAIEELVPWETEGELDVHERAALQVRLEVAQRRLKYENRMSSTQLDTQTPGHPTPEGQQVGTGTTGFPSHKEKNEELVSGNLGHTPPKIDTSIPPTLAIPPELAPMGITGVMLAVLLSALQAAGCKGPCPASILGPVMRGSQGVPGHLQG